MAALMEPTGGGSALPRLSSHSITSFSSFTAYGRGLPRGKPLGRPVQNCPPRAGEVEPVANRHSMYGTGHADVRATPACDRLRGQAQAVAEPLSRTLNSAYIYIE